MAKYTNFTRNVVNPFQISDSITTYYTAPATAGGEAVIDELTVTNDTTTAITFSIYKIQSGGSYGATNFLLNTQTLSSSDTFSIIELIGKIHLGPSGFIQMIASVANQATVQMAAMEMS
jgi:hypothetical protein